MAASDYVPIFFKNRLHLAGRPQMSSRPSSPGAVWRCVLHAGDYWVELEQKLSRCLPFVGDIRLWNNFLLVGDGTWSYVNERLNKFLERLKKPLCPLLCGTEFAMLALA